MNERPVWMVTVFGLFLGSAIMLITSCFAWRSSDGGGQVDFTPPRAIAPADIALPSGYSIEAIATGLTFPSGVAFDEQGGVYVSETGYSYGEVWKTPRLLRIQFDGNKTVVAQGDNNGPWTGVVFFKGEFYVAEGGAMRGGRILRITPEGVVSSLIDGLPSTGDHHTNGPAISPDGAVYFAVGSTTNSGVVGEDNAKFGWMARHPTAHDIPCQNITLAGQNFETPDVRAPDRRTTVVTGAYSPFGQATQSQQTIPGRIPCTGAILKIARDGAKLELVAWGLRNPFGLAFAPDGRLFATDNSYDDRGSRPVHGAGDLLWDIRQGAWYGWPDFHGAHPLSEGDHHLPPGKPRPTPLLAVHPSRPSQPTAILDVHSSANGFDFSRNATFGYTGDAFIALFGDQAPATGKVWAPVGFKVVRVNVETGVVQEFAVNKGKTNGPASRMGGGGFERPIAARFDPSGKALYVVDFGVLTMDKDGKVHPYGETGVLWKITKDGMP